MQFSFSLYKSSIISKMLQKHSFHQVQLENERMV